MVKGIVLLSCYVLTAGLFWFSHQLANDMPPYSSMGNLALIALPFLAILTLTIVLILSAILRKKTNSPATSNSCDAHARRSCNHRRLLASPVTRRLSRYVARKVQ